jgi:hypothetical protein
MWPILLVLRPEMDLLYQVLMTLLGKNGAMRTGGAKLGSMAMKPT